MQSWAADFGYELIEDDWKLQFPAPDLQLAKVVQQAIAQPRAELAAAAMLRAQRHAALASYSGDGGGGDAAGGYGPGGDGDDAGFSFGGSGRADHGGGMGLGRGGGGPGGNGSGAATGPGGLEAARQPASPAAPAAAVPAAMAWAWETAGLGQRRIWQPWEWPDSSGRRTGGNGLGTGTGGGHRAMAASADWWQWWNWWNRLRQ